MSIRTTIGRVLQEDLNFLLTNRIPRRMLTRFTGWFSRIRHPLVRDLSIAVWKQFSGLDLSDARKSTFDSVHDCFTRELKEGARPVCTDPRILISPCDAIVGATGQVIEGTLIQAKGFPYKLRDLLHDPALVETYRDGIYATLRLTSAMYHRFHSPANCRIEQVTYISGDTWNVNPIALRRIENLFCRNERAVVRMRLEDPDHLLALVPVAAISVASIRLHFLDVLLHLDYRGPAIIPCEAALRRGEEMGWFQHGSTIIVFAPAGFTLAEDVREGMTLRMGQPLLCLP